jgi:hypothetical protein
LPSELAIDYTGTAIAVSTSGDNQAPSKGLAAGTLVRGAIYLFELRETGAACAAPSSRAAHWQRHYAT